jgi:3-deoxy-D-manno-octulosonic-acid transferase
LLVNARLSEQSALGYQRLGTLTRSVLQGFAGVAAQTPEDADRLRVLGAANVVVTGNLKFDLEPPRDQIELGKLMRTLIGERPVWLAASTRAGEEKLILDAYCKTAAPNVLLVLVPRHPQRFDEVAQLVRERGLKMQRRSDNAALRADTRVWLGDSLGEMFAYYSMADCALIGGSLLPYGGQNLIEACAVGCPALLGPHTENFKQAAEDAIARGAALRVSNAGEWVAQAAALTGDETARGRMGEAGQAFAAAHRGAAERVWKTLQLARRSQTQVATKP